MAPAPFDAVSLDEDRVIEMDEIVRERDCFKYSYLSPKMKAIVGGSFIGLLVTIGVVVATKQHSTGSWPPPSVSSGYDLYTDGSPVALSLNMKAGKSYRQRTEMETSSSISLGKESFAETMHMTTENSIDVNEWKNDDGELKGKTAEVTFTHLAVTTVDSEGDSTYYNSYAKTGDTSFDAILETMIGESATIYLDNENFIVNEEDNQNALESMEQEYSLGTTTGLSATDQVASICNVIAFLPDSASSSTTFSVGDTWDIEFETDLLFKGTSTFKGFTKYNGVQCAVIESKANIDDETENSLGAFDDEATLEVKNGKVESLIFFDIKEQIPLYTKTAIAMTTDIGSLENDDYDYDGDDKNDIDLPMTEVIEVFFSPTK